MNLGDFAQELEERSEQQKLGVPKPDSTDDLIVTGDLVRVGCRLGLELG